MQNHQEMRLLATMQCITLANLSLLFICSTRLITKMISMFEMCAGYEREREREECFCIKNFVGNKTVVEKQARKKASCLVGKCKFSHQIKSVFNKEKEEKDER